MDSLSDKKILNQTTTPAYFAGSLLNNIRVDNTPNAQLRDTSGKIYKMPADRSAFLKFVAKFEAKAKSTGKLGLASLLLIPLAACGGSSSGTGAVAPTGTPGDARVFDGAISGAEVWRDANGNGVKDAGEASVLTAADGSFNPATLGSFGPLMATGGTDIVTGKSYVGITLSAPAGSTVISPVTTMIQNLVAAGKTVAAAETEIQAALGIDADTATKSVDLLNFDATTSTDTELANDVIFGGQAVIMAVDMLMDVGGMTDYAAALKLVSDELDNGDNITDVTTLRDLLAASGNTDISTAEADALAGLVAGKMAILSDAIEAGGHTSAAAVTAFKDLDSFNGKDGDGKAVDASATNLVKGNDIPGTSTTLAELVDGAKVQADFTALVAAGIKSFNITTGTLELTVAQAAQVKVSGTLVTLKDTAANINADAGSAAIISSGVQKIEVTDAGGAEITLTAKAGGQLAAAGITGATKVTVSDAATLEEIQAIDLAAGALTPVYTQLADKAATLATDTNDHVKGAVKVTITDDATVAQASNIDGQTTGSVTYSLKDTGAAIAASGATGNGAINLTVSDVATIAQAKTILDLSNSGTTTYSVSGTIADLILAANNAAVQGGSEVIVTGGTPNSADLATLKALVGSDVKILDSSVTINGTAENILADAAFGTMVQANVTGDDMTIAQLTAIDKANGDTAVVTITGGTIKDTAANLAADETYIKDAVNTKTAVNVEVTDFATIAQLTEIKVDMTAGGMDGAASFSDTSFKYAGVADTATLLQGNAGGFVKAGTDVTITDRTNISDLTAIDAANGDGALNYGAVEDTHSNLTPAVAVGGDTTQSLTAANVITSGLSQNTATLTVGAAVDVGDVFSVTINGTVFSYVAAAATTADVAVGLIALINADKTLKVTASGTSSPVTLTADDNATVITLTDVTATNYTFDAATYLNGHSVVVTDASITMAKLKEIDTDNGTSHGVTLKAAGIITDTAANLIANDGGYITGAVNVTVTDIATLSQLATLDALTTGTLKYTGGITGTAADLAANAGDYIKSGENVTIASDATLAQLATIANTANTAVSGGNLTFEAVISDSAANFTAAAVTGASHSGGADNGTTVTFGGTVSAGDTYTVIVGDTTSDTFVYTALKDDTANDVAVALAKMINDAKVTSVTATAHATTGLLTLSEAEGVFNGAVTSADFKIDSNVHITGSIDSADLKVIQDLAAADNGKTVDVATVSIKDGVTETLTAETVDGASFTLGTLGTGKLIITGSGGNQTITGTKNDDTITGGAGADTINVGAGDDTVIIASGDIGAARDTFSTGTSAEQDALFAATGDIIKGLTNGDGTSDSIDLTGATGITDTALTTVKIDKTDLDLVSGTLDFAATGIVRHSGTSIDTANDWIKADGTIDGATMTKALALITGATATASQSGYLAISAGTGTDADMGLFYINNGADTSIANSEIQFIGVLEDFGTSLDDGFVISI